MADSLLAIVMKLTLALISPDVTLLFAGDAMQHQSQLDAARVGKGEYDYTECFAPLAPMIEQADYAIVNLETPIGASGFTGYPCFNAPVSYARALRDVGFDLFLTANNHTLDRRDRGLRNTIEALDSLGVAHLGTYANDSCRHRQLPFVKDIKGYKIGFLNYTYGTNGIEIQKDVVVDYIDTTLIASDIARLRQAGAEIIIAAMHWGIEYQLTESKQQRRLADWLVGKGVDIVMGGHPHVVQPMYLRQHEDGRNYLIVYSLGNFISGMKTRDTRGGALAVVRLSRDENGRAVVADAHYEYVYTVPPQGSKDKYRVMPIDSVPEGWKQQAQSFRHALCRASHNP